MGKGDSMSIMSSRGRRKETKPLAIRRGGRRYIALSGLVFKDKRASYILYPELCFILRSEKERGDLLPVIDEVRSRS
jgi:hypothetical protein